MKTILTAPGNKTTVLLACDDEDRAELEFLEGIRPGLVEAFSTPDEAYVHLSADDIRRRALAGTGSDLG